MVGVGLWHPLVCRVQKLDNYKVTIDGVGYIH